MDQRAGLAAPKIVSLDFTPLEYVLPSEKAYGMARGLNFRRTVALVTVTAEDGSSVTARRSGRSPQSANISRCCSRFFSAAASLTSN